jgi:uncharacterized protein
MTFVPPATWTSCSPSSLETGVSLFDFVDMRDELEELLGRKVDVLSRRGVETSTNPYRKKAILDSARTIYAAA